MQHLIAKIGKGRKGAKDLTWEEAKEAMRALMEGLATPGQVGAFLMAMRIKNESISELAAFTSVARQYVHPLKVPSTAPVVDVPLYGEKHGTYHVIAAAALVAAAAGATLLLHGVDNPEAGVNPSEVFRHLHLPLADEAGRVPDQLAACRLSYLDLMLYHPPVARLLDLRHEFGGQNLGHQVARMLNPARAASQVIGIAHPPYLSTIAEALNLLDTPRALVVQGVEGYPELSISAPTPARELRNGHITPFTFRPQDIGLRFGSYETMSVESLKDQLPRPAKEAEHVLKILRQQVRGDHRAWVLFNAAMLVYAAGKAPTLAQAAPLVQQALDSGAAYEFWQSLASNDPTRGSDSMPSREVVPA